MRWAVNFGEMSSILYRNQTPVVFDLLSINRLWLVNHDIM